MLLVLLFATTFRWLPPGGFVPWQDNPVGALRLTDPAGAGAGPAAGGEPRRGMRDALADVARLRLCAWRAQARGLTMSEAMRRHGVRNATLPVLHRPRRAGWRLSSPAR